MTEATIGFAGLTHLGLNSAAAAAAHGYPVIGYHDDPDLIARLTVNELPLTEPDLPELLAENRERLSFTADPSALGVCDIVFIASDVPTDGEGNSDLAPITQLIHKVCEKIGETAVLVILCQVPPGFTRKIVRAPECLFYQVETLIFGKAVERALHPERLIIGCAEADQPIDARLRGYLDSFECPILQMRYESAELAKISINLYLVASISVANTMAEICEQIGADWEQIAPALRLDRRIGRYAYLKPGLGIAGGNLERDLVTVRKLSEHHGTDGSVVDAWMGNSLHRRDWAWRILNKLVLEERKDPRIAVLGLTYKENTDSTKDSPSLALLHRLENIDVSVYDPVVKSSVDGLEFRQASSALDALGGADVLLVMTPWPEFSDIPVNVIDERMATKVVIDPFRMLDGKGLCDRGFTYASIGIPIEG